MPTRYLTIIGLASIVIGTTTQLPAELVCAAVDSVVHDVKARQCWPRPYTAMDEATVCAPFAIQVANGWKKQNMLGEAYFEPQSGQLTQAGRMKVRWILTVCPRQHRIVYVHTAERDEETAARMAAVQQLVCQIGSADLPPVLPTSISDDGWPAEQVDMIGRKFWNRVTPMLSLPGLPAGSSGGSGSSSGN